MGGNGYINVEHEDDIVEMFPDFVFHFKLWICTPFRGMEKGTLMPQSTSLLMYSRERNYPAYNYCGIFWGLKI